MRGKLVCKYKRTLPEKQKNRNIPRFSSMADGGENKNRRGRRVRGGDGLIPMTVLT